VVLKQNPAAEQQLRSQVADWQWALIEQALVAEGVKELPASATGSSADKGITTSKPRHRKHAEPQHETGSSSVVAPPPATDNPSTFMSVMAEYHKTPWDYVHTALGCIGWIVIIIVLRLTACEVF